MPVKGPACSEAGSRVRGTCYHYLPDKGFGFLRYLVRLGDLSLTDTRDPDSPYWQAFVHLWQVPVGFEVGHVPTRMGRS